MSHKKTYKKKGGSTLKPVPVCQCMENNKGCANRSENGSLFCKKHKACPISPRSGSEPEYAPERYNNDPTIYKSHNCYSYGMNVIDPAIVTKCRLQKDKINTCRNNFHQPGALNGSRFALNAESRRTCPVVEKLMTSDVPDIQHSSFEQRCPKGMSKIALVVDPGEDYHFYRQDKDGMWSHKDGSNKVKRYDALKRPIVNPQLASRDYRWQGSDLNYSDFCGFYCVPRAHAIRLGQGGARTRKNQKQKKPMAGGSWTDRPSQ